jgi:hypothetical protein
MRKFIQTRAGTVAVMSAVSLVVMMSMVAIAIDGGLLMDDRRRAQSAADAAALAGAADLFLKWQINQGLDKQGTAWLKATVTSGENGFPNPEVYIPPISGPFAGKAGYIEVIVHYSQPRAFSRIWGSTDLPVTARAVAQGRWGTNKNGIILLDPTAPGSLTITGGGTMTVAGVPTIVDSNSPSAVTTTGGAATLVTPELDVTGIPGVLGAGVIGTVNSGSPPVPDPLAYLPEPDPSTMVVQSSNQTKAANGTLNIQPGVYDKGISISGQATLNMAPGIYYMRNGGFSFTGQGNLNAAGVMIFTQPNQSSDIVNIQGTGAINFSPPTSGIYRGIAFFQERSSSNVMNISGNGQSQMSGTFYAAHGTLNVTGNGAQDTLGSQYISYDLTVNGNGNFAVNWDVNLTGKIRIITLVE